MIVDPRIRASWAAYSTPLEGCVPHLYLDARGLVTVAIGALVDSPILAANLTGWDAPGAVVADWHRVKAMPPGLLWTHYASPGSPRLSLEGIAAVTTSRLDQAADQLARSFPDFYAWPAAAQAAALSLAWACGAGWPSSWPHLAASCRAGDWQAAASNCEIRSAGNPGVVPRNLCQRALFELAAGVSVEDALAGIPAGYTGDAARRALEGLVVSTWALDGSEPTLDGTGGG